MKVRMKGVIFKNNFEDIKLLLELSRESRTSLSLGFVVPDVNVTDNGELFLSHVDDTGTVWSCQLF